MIEEIEAGIKTKICLNNYMYKFEINCMFYYDQYKAILYVNEVYNIITLVFRGVFIHSLP